MREESGEVRLMKKRKERRNKYDKRRAKQMERERRKDDELEGNGR